QCADDRQPCRDRSPAPPGRPSSVEPHRQAALRVAAALRAAALRAAGPRRRAACRAWRASATELATARPSRRRAPRTARERDGEGRRPPRRPVPAADAALRRVVRLAPFGGGPSLTPARRALLRPMAIACFVE